VFSGYYISGKINIPFGWKLAFHFPGIGISKVMTYRRYQGFNLTPVLLLIVTNIVIFIAARVNPGLILVWLGLHPDAFPVMPWTIVTNLFVHYHIWHLIANMVTLYFFGRFLSGLLGGRSLLIIYFLGGILGNVCYLLLPPSPPATVIGASGAIFALGGALAVVVPRLKVFVFPIPVPLPLWVAVIGGFFIISFLPQVAWQAHLGGLVLGLIAGLFFRRRQRRFF
jgi:membrane associated rhomboid family serine protease